MNIPIEEFEKVVAGDMGLCPACFNLGYDQRLIDNLICPRHGKLPMKASITEYLASIGAKGGKVKSTAKSASARKNGKKGGRPKKS
jgi:hypothetical protein